MNSRTLGLYVLEVEEISRNFPSLVFWCWEKLGCWGVHRDKKNQVVGS